MTQALRDVLQYQEVRRASAVELPPEFSKSLCKIAANVRRAGYQHDVVSLKVSAKVMYAVAKANLFEPLAWHAQQIHDLDFADCQSLPRLYELLDGMERALEGALERIRLAH